MKGEHRKLSTASNEEQLHGIWGPLYNLVCTVAGTGILQLAFTLKQSGWIQLGILLLVAAMANYTGKIIILCLYEEDDENAENSVNSGQERLMIQMNQPARLDNYMAIGEKAFGQTGRYLVHFFQKMELCGVACLFLILCGKFFTEGLSEDPQDYIPLDTQQWILVSAGLVVFPLLTFHDLEEVAGLSVFGAVAVILVVLTIISFCTYDLITDTNTGGGHQFIDWQNLPITFAGTVVSFGGQPVYPSVEKSMADRKLWPKVLNYTYIVLLCMYLPVAILGYWTFGDGTYSPILCNLPRSGPITIIMKLLIAFHVLCAYPIIVNVICKEAEQAFITEQNIENYSGDWWLSNLLRTCIVVLTVVVAYFVPYFADFMSFIGGVAVSFNTYVLPVIFYLKLRKTTTTDKIICSIILIASFAGGAFGGLLSVKNLYDKFRAGADPLDG